MTLVVQGEADLAVQVARVKADDPAAVVHVEALGGRRFRIEVMPSPSKDGDEVELVRKQNCGTVARTWAPWR